MSSDCTSGTCINSVCQSSCTPEVCNGLDDDCDEEIDEGVTNACNECGAVPAETCDGMDDDRDEEVNIARGKCGAETCNGLDDDCDEEVDEGVTNACNKCGAVPPEACNGMDDECDGEVDEGVPNACNRCGAVPAESCNGRDDDCDKRVDEGVKNACDECGAVPAETCNGLDDNCDGVPDNGLFMCTLGRVCVDGRCEAPCGNGRIDPGEQCDDANRDDNDRCNNLCRWNEYNTCLRTSDCRPGWDCTGFDISNRFCTKKCGSNAECSDVQQCQPAFSDMLSGGCLWLCPDNSACNRGWTCVNDYCVPQ